MHGIEIRVSDGHERGVLIEFSGVFLTLHNALFLSVIFTVGGFSGQKVTITELDLVSSLLTQIQTVQPVRMHYGSTMV